jgi:hypothetical protein
MTQILRIELLVVSLIYLLIVINTVRKGKINIGYSIIWIFSGGVLLLSAIIPQIIDTFSNLLGFAQPSNMIFAMSIVIIFFIIFSLTIIVSNQTKKINLLVQEISLLKSERMKDR